VPDTALFYNKAHEIMFSRPKSYFEEMGYDAYETPYTFSNSYDREYGTINILVPRTLVDGNKPSVILCVHGGGFISSLPCN
jgi:hypothetical protein